MRNREILNYRKQTLQVLGLALDIQNKGIGTAFFNLDAHVSRISVQVHLTTWTSGSGPSVQFAACIGDDSTVKEIDTVIKEMEDFISYHTA